jgi:hypothetical protein
MSVSSCTYVIAQLGAMESTGLMHVQGIRVTETKYKSEPSLLNLLLSVMIALAIIEKIAHMVIHVFLQWQLRVTSEDRCVVCMVNVRTHIIFPCKHLDVCEGCYQMIDSCPSCRGEMKAGSGRVYRS